MLECFKQSSILLPLERGEPARIRFEVFVYTNIKLVRHPKVLYDSIRLLAFTDRPDMRFNIICGTIDASRLVLGLGRERLTICS